VAVLRTILETPPVARVVPDGVFDDFGWCPSDVLEWRRPEPWSPGMDLTATNPAGMIFVMRGPCDYLPRELARLHAPNVGLHQEWALAPYGLDDATDALHAHRAPPGSLLWLHAADLAGLIWGLHDWAHFHNHGPFEARAWTELQCDTAALAWLALNLGAVGLDAATWERARAQLSAVARARFGEEGHAAPSDDPLSVALVRSVLSGTRAGVDFAREGELGVG
jgi:hypothetical protein